MAVMAMVLMNELDLALTTELMMEKTTELD
jgi:hypothetical protein